MATHTLTLPEVDLVYDVHGPLPAADGRPPLVLVGQPRTAEGFAALASHLTDRTVITYDPRGQGRSSRRRDGRDDFSPIDQAADLHALVRHLGIAPVQVFAGSGGAAAALLWVTDHPDEVSLLIAHEPPSVWALPDAERVYAGFSRARTAYAERGFGHGLAAFLELVSVQGEIPADYMDRPLPAPGAFGLPAADDGRRDHPLLSDRSASVARQRFDLDVLRTGTTPIVLTVGEDSGEVFTARATRELGHLLGVQPVPMPGGHEGFDAEDAPVPGRATAFAQRLEELLDAA